MVSKIVMAYLRSTFRATLLRAGGDSGDHALIYIEHAKIAYGKKEDDGKIVNFLERLGDVDVKILMDRGDALNFKPGTFDNWIQIELFRDICRRWKYSYSERVYFYDMKLFNEKKRDDVNIVIDPVNCLFEVKGGLKFPQIVSVEGDYYRRLLYRVWREDYRRYVINLEEPFSILNFCTPKLRRGRDILVVAEEHHNIISIVETSNDDWITRAEAVKRLNRRKHGVMIGGRCVSLDGCDCIDISSVYNHGVIELFDDVDIDNVKFHEIFHRIRMGFDDLGRSYTRHAIYRDEP